MNRFLLTMQYDEDFILPIFLQHYGKYFAPENIFIIDHGSRTNLVPAACNRIFVPRKKSFSEHSRQLLIRNLAQGLLNYYDYGVFADCDELIALEHLDERELHQQPEIYVAGFEVFWRKNHQSKAVLCGLINPSECKPLIFTRTPLWSLGFHASASCTPNLLTIPMAHIRFLYQEQAIARLAGRKPIYEDMSAEDKAGGLIATHWGYGDETVRRFHSHVSRFNEPSVSPEVFSMMDPKILFTFVPQILSDGRQVVVPVASSEWELLPNHFWDLSKHFPRLSPLVPIPNL